MAGAAAEREVGELELRGASVTPGYFERDDITAATFRDGWLRTGDIGTLDADGFLAITDRKKDIIVTAGGKNVSPQNIEAALKASRYISEALVIGDRRPYLVALLCPNPDETQKAAQTDEEVQALIQRTITADDLPADPRRLQTGARPAQEPVLRELLELRYAPVLEVAGPGQDLQGVAGLAQAGCGVGSRATHAVAGAPSSSGPQRRTSSGCR